METLDHRGLKQLALTWLFAHGCRAVALEVTSAIPRWRVDAAGWRHTAGAPESIVIECKQSRADFFRDDASHEQLLKERDRLRVRRGEVEESRIKVYEPHLGRSDPGLFEDHAIWDFTRSRLADYRRLLVGLRRVDQALHGETKFCLLSRYRLADRLYLMCPQGMLRPRELPEGWGLLEVPRRVARRALRTADPSVGSVRETVIAPPLSARVDRRDRLLRNIAIAASRAAFGQFAPRAETPLPAQKDPPRKKGVLF
ncbi:MAG: hypothetical protein EXS01_04975 [Phycisphaerales bacterium]|nr:hypothetical protein [Phycisphaerales bacterium]